MLLSYFRRQGGAASFNGLLQFLLNFKLFLRHLSDLTAHTKAHLLHILPIHYSKISKQALHLSLFIIQTQCRHIHTLIITQDI